MRKFPSTWLVPPLLLIACTQAVARRQDPPCAQDAPSAAGQAAGPGDAVPAPPSISPACGAWIESHQTQRMLASVPLPKPQPPLRPYTNSMFLFPLTPMQKAELAGRETIDPFNMLVIGGNALVATATTPHSAYGPGGRGFARRFGTDMTEVATGSFFGTFLWPSIFGQDPRYHRLPGAPLGRRIVHALGQVIVTESDHGTPIFNYGEVLGTISSATLNNVYVPDRQQGFSATAQRVGVSIGSDSGWNLLTEFLPDVMQHIDIRIVVLRRLAEHQTRQQ